MGLIMKVQTKGGTINEIVIAAPPLSKPSPTFMVIFCGIVSLLFWPVAIAWAIVIGVISLVNHNKKKDTTSSQEHQTPH